jgi:threonine synthase
MLSHCECPRCGTTVDADTLIGTCDCGSPLLARYDLDAVRRAAAPEQIAGRPADLWRYHELLPVRDRARVVTLGEGWTPLVPAPRYGGQVGAPNLLIKDEGIIPTGSFKARGAAVGISRARELGVRHIAMPTNGNAGAAWATYAARAGIRSTIAMPDRAPSGTRLEILAAGADLHLVNGLIGDAAAVIRAVVTDSAGSVFDASTLREPYRIEGKKTLGLEIVEQLGWRTPDVIIYPTGGGVGLIGIHKGLSELRELGWLPHGPGPKMVAVQATGCAPIVRAFAAGERRTQPWSNAETIAFGITVPAPLGDELILDALRESGGTAVAVDDDDILVELSAIARHEGMLVCPEGAACLAAVRRLRADGWLTGTEQIVVINTGSGLKYPDALAAALARRSGHSHDPLRASAGPRPRTG